jgi:D-glycero-alpha-D-manno-heptose-7-phosphate kinase
MLFYTGIKRIASEVADSYVGSLLQQEKIMHKKRELVDEGTSMLCGSADICRFGDLLHKEWGLKRGLGSQVSNGTIDGLYKRARQKGAIGGKITGAGGGGFLLLFVPPTSQKAVRNELKELLHVPIQFESEGSRIIFFDSNEEDYSQTLQDRDAREIKNFVELHPIRSEGNKIKQG